MVLDLAVRPRELWALSAGMKAVYLGSAIAGSGLWGATLWLASRLFLVGPGPLRGVARCGLGALFAGVFLPFACIAYGGQVIYYHVFHAYISRDTVRLGIRLRGTVGAWLLSWGAASIVAALAGVILTVLCVAAVRRAAAPAAHTWPIVPALSFALAAYCYGTDFIETRALQAAPPDACFLHGVVYALRMAVSHRGAPPRGVTVRTPDPLPKIAPAAHRPNVVVILSESVRADALCSAKRDTCDAPFLDEAAPRRYALGKLTTQSSGTFTSSMMLWTGLPPDADFLTAHRAPMLWEIAKAVGYRTAYIAAQNLLYQDLSTYVSRAGIDVLVGAAELGDAPDVHIGAPDERATARTLAFVREVPAGTPYFALVHLSNTHWPYRVDPALQPYAPHDDDPLAGREKLHNHYRNSVRLQERTVAAFIDDLKALPGWDDTAVLFLSDHGEAFREHGRLYHLNNLYDEEVRIPGFIVSGDAALDEEQRASLIWYEKTRTYSQDVHATVLDLLGVLDQRGALPFADLVTGRSLLRPRPKVEPIVIVSTTSGVWEDDDPVYGARRGELLVVGTDTRPFQCFDSNAEPRQRHPAPLLSCAPILDVAEAHFPMVPVPAAE
jgi:arylsulfatase A-like enzyme